MMEHKELKEGVLKTMLEANRLSLTPGTSFEIENAMLGLGLDAKITVVKSSLESVEINVAVLDKEIFRGCIVRTGTGYKWSAM